MKTRFYMKMNIGLCMILLVLSLSIVGFSITALANPLSVGSHFDYQKDEFGADYYGYHYIVTLGYLETAHDFCLFTDSWCPGWMGETVEDFTNSFLQSGTPGSDTSTNIPYNFYQPTGWDYELVYDGTWFDPVFTKRNDYVHWYATSSGYDIKGPTDPCSPDFAKYFGFSSTTPPVNGAYDFPIYSPPKWEPIHVPAPEPATVALLGLGSLALLRRRRKA